MERYPGDSGRSRIRAVVPVLVVFAMLAAVLLLLRPPFDSLVPESDEVIPAVSTDPAMREDVTATETSVESDIVERSSQSGVRYRTLPASRIALLPARIVHEDAQAREMLESIRQAIVVRLGSEPEVDELVSFTEQQLVGILPVVGSTVPTDMLAYLVVTRRLGDVLVVELSESSSVGGMHWSFDLRFNGPQTRANLASVSVARAEYNAVDPQDIAAEFVEDILNMAAQSALDLAVSAERMPLANARTDKEQIRALRSLGPAGFDSDAMAMAVSVGAGAQDAADRRSAWLLLRDRVYDPVLADTLSYALLSDADPSVREAAAEALGMYVSIPAARAALELAAGNDISTEVRLTAQLSTMSRSEVTDFVQATLQDRSLAPEQRIAPMVRSFNRDLDGGLSQRYGQADIESARALVDIVATTDDYQVRSQGLEQLQQFVQRAHAGGDVGPELIDLLAETALVSDSVARLSVIRSLNDLPSIPEARSSLDEIVEQHPEIAQMLPFYFRNSDASGSVPGLQ